jgi:two-component system, OmpR family, response regulator
LSTCTRPGSYDGAPRVLVISDETKLAALIRKALNEQGMPADLASNAEDAVRITITSSYDVLLLDVDLRGIDGFDLCRRLREERVSAPILMLTAGDRIDERSTDTDEGADDYIAKPFDLNELFVRVRRLAGRELI